MRKKGVEILEKAGMVIQSKMISKFRLSAVLVLVFAGFSAKAQTLISFYDFDNSMADSVRGASGDATVIVGTAAYAPGKVGQAFAFNGSTLIRSPLAGAGLTAFSISAWVNFSNKGQWSTIVSNWGEPSIGAFILGLNSSSGQLGNYIGTNLGYGAAVDPTQVTTGQWYHVMATIGGGAQDFYVNGSKVATYALGGSLLNTFQYMSMGAKLNEAQNGPAPTTGYLTGYVDDLAFFNGKLTPSQVTTVYTQGLTGQSVSAVVPEPSALSLLAIGLGGLAIIRRRLEKAE